MVALIKARIRSFRYAINGLVILLEEEPNATIHALGAVVALTLGAWLQVSTIEWICLAFANGIVIAAEIFNSAIENLADFVTNGHSNLIKKVKDLAAAAVLVSAITAAITGLIIFLPKIL